MVVVYHAALFGFKLPGRVDRFGWIGVDLFFVLSGYLIGGQLLAQLARGQRINLGRFFTRRALRIMRCTSPCSRFIFCCRRGGNIPKCHSRSGNFCCPYKTSRFMAEPLSHMLGHSQSRTNSISRFLFFCSFSSAVRALAIIIPCLIVIGGIGLRAFLAAQNPSVDDGGVSFRGFQAWIYYPTWTRLDPLVFGVALAAIEKFRPTWWKRLMNCAPWLWLPASD